MIQKLYINKIKATHDDALLLFKNDSTYYPLLDSHLPRFTLPSCHRTFKEHSSDVVWTSCT